MEISVASTDAEIAGCHPVMSELRPHISAAEFVPPVRRLQTNAGFQLAFLRSGGDIKSVAGFRVSEWLAGGRYLEIEDLVSKASDRSKGYGGILFDWLKNHAAHAGCKQLRLVSSVRRLDAHRFYVRKGMVLDAHFFSMNISACENTMPNNALQATREDARA